MNETNNNTVQDSNLKFCKHCGGKIPQDAIICTLCGKQVEQLQNMQANIPNIVINNANSNINSNSNVNAAVANRMKNKWVALLLCFFLGFFGAHKFYEGKVLLGIVYIFTGGLFFIGVFVDLITLLFKPNPYFV